MSNDITARNVVQRIQENLGAPWKSPTVDLFHAGDPDTAVTGVATTFTPTLDVLRRAVAGQKNMIISFERAFYRRDRPSSGPRSGAPPASDGLENDPAYRFKKDFVAENNLVIWRFHDNWLAREPDGQLRGLARALGWEDYHLGEAPYTTDNAFFAPPGATLGEMAEGIQERLNIRGIRVIGDPETKVSKVALSHGMFRVSAMQAILNEPGVDAVVIGEPVEWEAVPYFQDIVASGRKMGMIILGHEVSEEPGSGEAAAWLKTIISEVPIEWISAGEPFWAP